MDGLTVSTAEKILDTGKTVSQIQKNEFQKGAQDSTPVGSFADTLDKAISSVNTLQKNADVMMEKIATGESKNIPEVMIAAEKADIALKLMVQVRNKIIDAYQEVMKMQV